MVLKKVLRLDLKNDYYAFGVILDDTYISVINFISKDFDFDLNEIIKDKGILFTNAVVYRKKQDTKEWCVLEREIEVDETFLKKKPYYKQDIINSEVFSLVLPPKYIEEKEATKLDCIGFEKMLVYQMEHVIDRINHHFFNTKIKWPSSLPFWYTRPTQINM